MQPTNRPATPPRRPGLTLGKIPDRAGQRIGIYGPGGIGKTSLACLAPGPVAIFDFDNSLTVLRPEGDIQVVQAATWDEVRAALQAPGWQNIHTIVLDSVTRLEELAVAHTLKTVPMERGTFVSSVEGYGYGKGYQHVFDTFLPILNDLDAHARAGRNIIMVMHDCTCNVPNPAGDDYIRYEPRLQSPTSGKASIRLRLREWLDHLFFVGYDIAVDKTTGLATMGGSRAIWTEEKSFCMAKRHMLLKPSYVYNVNDNQIWKEVFNGAKG